ncbi:hypothetical protein [Desulfosporosinus hippei]|uniref:HMA domain-containing protein n=1 Tax=Desulfosporosinus hippei DSM 8344 TaxID=1121419 RepID=A0A1G8IBC5_9FIRM|nr:hypothetical protein [Desulfosporosinus hippei]SDI16127.1 hypothetical protein SAMN05443529_12822 [Desulfosporosinus hippei DSM 8344]
MVTGEITLDIDEENKTSLQQILEQLEGILQYQLKHRDVIVFYDSQRISYDQILETALQANYHISRFYVTEEEC